MTGIGTTTVTSQLTVPGTIETVGNGGIKFPDGTTQISSANPLPAGVGGQTLRYSGSGWVATSTITNDGTSVGIGTNPQNATLDVNGNIRVRGTVSTLPAAAAAYRGVIYLLLGGGGVADKLYICMKTSADGYSWVQIAIAN